MQGQRTSQKTTHGRAIARIRNNNNNPKIEGPKPGDWFKVVLSQRGESCAFCKTDVHACRRYLAGEYFDRIPFLKFNFKNHPAPRISGIRHSV